MQEGMQEDPDIENIENIQQFYDQLNEFKKHVENISYECSTCSTKADKKKACDKMLQTIEESMKKIKIFFLDEPKPTHQ